MCVKCVLVNCVSVQCVSLNCVSVQFILQKAQVPCPACRIISSANRSCFTPIQSNPMQCFSQIQRNTGFYTNPTQYIPPIQSSTFHQSNPIQCFTPIQYCRLFNNLHFFAFVFTSDFSVALNCNRDVFVFNCNSSFLLPKLIDIHQGVHQLFCNIMQATQHLGGCSVLSTVMGEWSSHQRCPNTKQQLITKLLKRKRF